MVSYITFSFAKNFLSRSSGTQVQGEGNGWRELTVGDLCRYSIRGSCGWCWLWDINIIGADGFFLWKKNREILTQTALFSFWHDLLTPYPPPILPKTYPRVHFTQIHYAPPPVPSTLLPCCLCCTLISFHSLLRSHPFHSISFLHSFWFFSFSYFLMPPLSSTGTTFGHETHSTTSANG